MKITLRPNFHEKLKRVVASAFALMLASSAFVLNNSALAKPFWERWEEKWEHHHHPPPSPHPRPVPEVSSGWVLLPVALVLLTLSSRHILRRRESEN